MRKLMGCAALLLAIAAPATAGEKYDRKLEKAVSEIIAEKIGDLRGGFAYDKKPGYVVRQDMATGALDT